MRNYPLIILASSPVAVLVVVVAGFFYGELKRDAGFVLWNVAAWVYLAALTAGVWYLTDQITGGQ